MNYSIHLYGQVWEWDDPIFSHKALGKKVPPCVGTISYTRPVLIVQDTRSIGETNSILCVPFTTKVDKTIGVGAQVPYGNGDSSNICIHKIFPADKERLTKYICTLPPDIMRKVEGELCRILCPWLTTRIPEAQVRDYFDISFRGTWGAESAAVSNFCEKKQEQLIISDVEIEKPVETVEPQPAPTQVETKEEVLPVATQEARKVEETKEEAQKAESIVYPRDIKQQHGRRRPAIIPAALQPHDVDVNKVYRNRMDPWTVDQVYELVYVYDNIGVEAASKMFSLNKGGARTCFYRWYKDAYAGKRTFYTSTSPNATIITDTSGPIEIIGSKTPEEQEAAKAAAISAIKKIEQNRATQQKKIPSESLSASVGQGISKLTDLISADMQSYSMYDCTREMARNPRAIISKEEFYKRISSAAYHSILSLLGIRTEKGDLIYPQIKSDDKNLATWFFLNKIQADPRFIECQSGEELMPRFRNVYGEYSKGINPEIKEILEVNLRNRMNLLEGGIANISGVITSTYCG